MRNFITKAKVFEGFEYRDNADKTITSDGTLSYVTSFDKAIFSPCCIKYVINTEQPIVYYKLDEDSGVVAKDEMGNCDGDLINSPVWTTGRKNNGLETGSAIADLGYLELTDNSVNFTGDTFTFETWIYLYDNPGAHAIYYRQDTSTNTLSSIAYDDTNERIDWTLKTDVSTYVFNTPNSSINENEWVHLVCVYDGSDIYIYINGTSYSTSASGDMEIDLTEDVWLGKDLNGIMDEVAIYDIALTSDDITNHYHATGWGNYINNIYIEPPSTWDVEDYNKIFFVSSETLTDENVEINETKITLTLEGTKGDWYIYSFDWEDDIEYLEFNLQTTSEIYLDSIVCFKYNTDWKTSTYFDGDYQPIDITNVQEKKSYKNTVVGSTGVFNGSSNKELSISIVSMKPLNFENEPYIIAYDDKYHIIAIKSISTTHAISTYNYNITAVVL